MVAGFVYHISPQVLAFHLVASRDGKTPSRLEPLPSFTAQCGVVFLERRVTRAQVCTEARKQSKQARRYSSMIAYRQLTRGSSGAGLVRLECDRT